MVRKMRDVWKGTNEELFDAVCDELTKAGIRFYCAESGKILRISVYKSYVRRAKTVISRLMRGGRTVRIGRTLVHFLP